jgi:1-phosphofructokinase
MTPRDLIAAVALNPAVDKTVTVPNFSVGKLNRARIEQIEPGGKGINVAKAVRKLGDQVVLLGFLGGSSGRAIAETLTVRDITSDCVFLAEETRVNLKVLDPVAGTETEINEPGFEVRPEHLNALEQKLEEYAERCVVIVFAGSLPPGAPAETYARLIQKAKLHGARTVLDCDGEALQLGIAAQPDLVKPNRLEAEQLLRMRLDTDADLLAGGRSLRALGAGQVVISLGAQGAVGVSAFEAWRARPPRVEPRSTIGAGDSMVAALAHGIKRNLPFYEALRLATAAGAATAAREGSSVADLKTIEDLFPQVVMEGLN